MQALVGTTLVLVGMASCAQGVDVDTFADDDNGTDPDVCDFSLCSGVCVDTRVDTANCGNCGVACATGLTCEGGACVGGMNGCMAPLTDCGGTCVDTATAAAHCGMCNNMCGASEVCNAGECGLDCGANQLDCGGMCVDPLSDPLYCGATLDCAGDNAGEPCGVGEICVGGACVLDCPAGQIDCGGMCIDPLTDPTYCGAIGNCIGANAGQMCQAGFFCDQGTCSAFTGIINFDEVVAPTVFSSTVALTNEYAGMGVTFAGPGAGQGGALLDTSSFCMSGHSLSNGLMFNSGVGYPTSPETITFNPPISKLRLNAGSASSGGTFTMTARNGAGVQLDQVSTSLSCAVQLLEVNGVDIVTVTFTGPSVFGVDDLYFEP